jgi:hypothetical protein
MEYEMKEITKIINVLQEQINDSINLRQEEIAGANLALNKLKKLLPKANSGGGASYAPLTILEITNIKEKAMQKKYKLFKEEKWKMNHVLTDGDVRLVIETYLENKGA